MEDRFLTKYYDKETQTIYTIKPIRNTCENGKDIIFYGILVSGDGQISECYLNEVLSDRFVRLQCSGLKDKNDKLIYEGDIVRLFGIVDGEEIDNKHVVRYGHFTMLNFEENFESGSTAVLGWYLGGQLLNIPLSLSIETSGMQIEIIGNIYENKEFLEA